MLNRNLAAFAPLSRQTWDHSLQVAAIARVLAAASGASTRTRRCCRRHGPITSASSLSYRAAEYPEYRDNLGAVELLVTRLAGQHRREPAAGLGLPGAHRRIVLAPGAARPVVKIPCSLADVVWLASLLAGDGLEWMPAVESEADAAESDRERYADLPRRSGRGTSASCAPPWPPDPPPPAPPRRRTRPLSFPCPAGRPATTGVSFCPWRDQWIGKPGRIVIIRRPRHCTVRNHRPGVYNRRREFLAGLGLGLPPLPCRPRPGSGRPGPRSTLRRRRPQRRHPRRKATPFDDHHQGISTNSVPTRKARPATPTACAPAPGPSPSTGRSRRPDLRPGRHPQVGAP